MEKDKNKTTNSYKLRFNTEKDKEIYKKLKKIKKESGISINRIILEILKRNLE